MDLIQSKSKEEFLKPNRILINPNPIRTSQVQLINSRLNPLMCNSIGSILSSNEIYCDLHYNIIETPFDGLEQF